MIILHIMRGMVLFFLLLIADLCLAQSKTEFNGQVSGIANYSPDNAKAFLVGGRYIPEFLFKQNIDSTKMFSLELSANLSGTLQFDSFDAISTNGRLDPYRMWARYSDKQYELRLGLQKIDFGSASVLRPLQWFNRIDPRDPLQLTNGVYAALGRYYFLNNANVWIWMLYGNEDARGYDLFGSDPDKPEYGGRIQHPVPKGEIAISFHHRRADISNLFREEKIQLSKEDKVGIDGKWDLGIGLWTEATYTKQERDLGILNKRTLLGLGMDYTFELGNGLGVLAEHMMISQFEKLFNTRNTFHISALRLAYPITLTDNLSVISFFQWENNLAGFSLVYEHQFHKFNGYIIPYYNPEGTQGLQSNDLVNNFSGPGLRIMAVYNH